MTIFLVVALYDHSKEKGRCKPSVTLNWRPTVFGQNVVIYGAQ
jgi:hypothetical protein